MSIKVSPTGIFYSKQNCQLEKGSGVDVEFVQKGYFKMFYENSNGISAVNRQVDIAPHLLLCN